MNIALKAGTAHRCWGEGVVLCVTGLSRSERSLAERLISAAGGSYSPSLSKRCTHLLVPNGGCVLPSDKLRSVVRNRKKWGLQLVCFDWLLVSAEQAERQQEERFPAPQAVPLTSINAPGGVSACQAVNHTSKQQQPRASHPDRNSQAPSEHTLLTQAPSASYALVSRRHGQQHSVPARPRHHDGQATSVVDSPSRARGNDAGVATSSGARRQTAAAGASWVPLPAATAAARRAGSGLDGLSEGDAWAHMPLTQAGFMPTDNLLQMLQAECAHTGEAAASSPPWTRQSGSPAASPSIGQPQPHPQSGEGRILGTRGVHSFQPKGHTGFSKEQHQGTTAAAAEGAAHRPSHTFGASGLAQRIPEAAGPAVATSAVELVGATSAALAPAPGRAKGPAGSHAGSTGGELEEGRGAHLPEAGHTRRGASGQAVATQRGGGARGVAPLGSTIQGQGQAPCAPPPTGRAQLPEGGAEEVVAHLQQASKCSASNPQPWGSGCGRVGEGDSMAMPAPLAADLARLLSALSMTAPPAPAHDSSKGRPREGANGAEGGGMVGTCAPGEGGSCTPLSSLEGVVSQEQAGLLPIAVTKDGGDMAALLRLLQSGCSTGTAGKACAQPWRQHGLLVPGQAAATVAASGTSQLIKCDQQGTSGGSQPTKRYQEGEGGGKEGLQAALALLQSLGRAGAGAQGAAEGLEAQQGSAGLSLGGVSTAHVVSNHHQTGHHHHQQQQQQALHQQQQRQSSHQQSAPEPGAAALNEELLQQLQALQRPSRERSKEDLGAGANHARRPGLQQLLQSLHQPSNDVRQGPPAAALAASQPAVQQLLELLRQADAPALPAAAPAAGLPPNQKYRLGSVCQLQRPEGEGTPEKVPSSPRPPEFEAGHSETPGRLLGRLRALPQRPAFTPLNTNAHHRGAAAGGLAGDAPPRPGAAPVCSSVGASAGPGCAPPGVLSPLDTSKPAPQRLTAAETEGVCMHSRKRPSGRVAPLVDVAPAAHADVAPHPLADLAMDSCADLALRSLADLAMDSGADLAPAAHADVALRPLADLAMDSCADLADSPEPSPHPLSVGETVLGTPSPPATAACSPCAAAQEQERGKWREGNLESCAGSKESPSASNCPPAASTQAVPCKGGVGVQPTEVVGAADTGSPEFSGDAEGVCPPEGWVPPRSGAGSGGAAGGVGGGERGWGGGVASGGEPAGGVCWDGGHTGSPAGEGGGGEELHTGVALWIFDPGGARCCRVAHAVQQGGGSVAHRGARLGQGATHVVCAPEAALKWISLGLGIVSPQWVLRSLKQGRQQRCLTLSADATRHLPSGGGGSSNLTKTLSAECSSRGSVAPLPQLDSKEGREALLAGMAAAAAAGPAVPYAAPPSLLTGVCWCVTDPPAAATLDHSSLPPPSSAPRTQLDVGEVIPDSEEEEEGWGCVGGGEVALSQPTHQAYQATLYSLNNPPSRGESTGNLEGNLSPPQPAQGDSGAAGGCHAGAVSGGGSACVWGWQQGVPRQQAWTREVVLRGGCSITIVFPRDGRGEVGHDPRSFTLEGRCATAEHLMHLIHSYYQEAVPIEEQVYLIRTAPASLLVSSIVKPTFLDLKLLARHQLLGARLSLEGLFKATRDPGGAVYELRLGC